ncbi:unnamed protein product [Parascedosporium putredinis]|uniref:Uncharacterized protein n=1 Tax=Parascedosporium putredinis TaxID=1442378 RepID=A0A9P1H575_9PEZI|nr:unnamed protein product [Parascedosporium putredinis]CAI7996263.1 unnamed protein product [Parascedosporium putredinis]
MVVNSDSTSKTTRVVPVAPKKTASIAERSSAAISALSSYFTIQPTGPVSIPTTLSLYSITQSCYTVARQTFLLPEDPSSPSLRLLRPSAAIDAIFDTDAKLFFEDAPLLANLTPDLKASLLAQAVAGLVLLFRRLADVLAAEDDVPFLTHDLFARELDAFRHSPERIAALTAIEASSLFSHGCRSRAQVARLVSRVVERAADEQELSDMLEDAGVTEDAAGSLGWTVERPRNMGLPWGFSILPVN